MSRRLRVIVWGVTPVGERRRLAELAEHSLGGALQALPRCSAAAAWLPRCREVHAAHWPAGGGITLEIRGPAPDTAGVQS